MNTSIEREGHHLIILTRVFGSLAALIGAITFLGWISGIPLLSAVESPIPMAPSTALLFIIYGILVVHRIGNLHNGALRRAELIIGSIGALVSVFFFFSSSWGIFFDAEHFGTTIVGTIDGMPVGHMSPLTAFCFVLVALSFLTAASSAADMPGRAIVAFWLASLVILISFVLLIAYLLGMPLFYGSGFIPPALSTSLAFLLHGIALTFLASRQAWSKDASGINVDKRSENILILVFLMLAVGIISSGYFYFRSYEKSHRTEVEHGLSAIAELKVSELSHWRKERLSDAAIFFRNRNFSGLVQQYFEKPENEDARERLYTWLSLLHAGNDYDRIILFDAHCVERMSVPVTPEPPPPHMLRNVSEALSSGRVTFWDFHREAPDDPIHLSILIPICIEGESEREIGILLLRIDPGQYLYPSIHVLPTPSRTAETLLIRRDGNDALYLNELRFQQNTALTLRIPLTREEVPAVKAILGMTGIVEGLDYKGEPVVADVRAVPDSPWFFVTRMNATEVYAPVRAKLLETIVLIVVLLFGAGTGAGLMRRQQLMRFFRERYESAEALRESEDRYHRTLDNMLEGCQIIGFDWRYLYVNNAAAKHGRATREELLGSIIMEKYPGIENTAMFAVLRRCMEDRTARIIENEFTYPDGIKGWFELSIQPVPEGIFMLSLDISERKRAEQRVEHLNRVLNAIRDVNELIIHEKDKDKLIRRICDVLVEHRGYSSALIVLTDETGYPESPVQAGQDKFIQARADEMEKAILPPCCEYAAAHEGVYHVADPSLLPSPGSLSRDSSRVDVMVIALKREKDVYGFLMVSVDGELGFDDEEQSLFEEMAGDVSFALYAIAQEKAMHQAKEERSRMESELLQAQKMEAVGRLAGGIAHDFNNMLSVILGYADVALSGTEPDNPFAHELREIKSAALRSAELTKQLLAFSRKQVVVPRVIDINEIIEMQLKILSRLIGEDIEISFIPGESLWKVLIDPSQVDQIMANLAVNSRDAIKGAGTILVKTENITLDEAYTRQNVNVAPGDYVAMSFEDSGIGIAPEIRDKIFEPFFTTKGEGKGTGLGLSTVYGIVKQNNGAIHVYSEPGLGTTFILYFPRFLGEAGKRKEMKESATVTGNETILVVEDEIQILELSEQILRQFGYTVLTAKSGSDAINRAQKYGGTIHLLLTDIVMPSMNGMELRERIRKMIPGIKILFMSGYTSDAIASLGNIEGGTDIIQKPFTMRSLAEMVRQVLDS